PLNRKPIKVLEDIREGYLSELHARRRYGVVLGNGDSVDEEGTKAERKCIFDTRTRLRVAYASRATFENGRRTGLVHVGDFDSIGEGLAELVTLSGAPLRIWLKSDSKVEKGTIPLDEGACQVLGIKVGD